MTDAGSGPTVNRPWAGECSTLSANSRAICADLTRASHRPMADAYSQCCVYCLPTYAGSGPGGNRPVTCVGSASGRVRSGTGGDSPNVSRPRPAGVGSLNDASLPVTGARSTGYCGPLGGCGGPAWGRGGSGGAPGVVRLRRWNHAGCPV